MMKFNTMYTARADRGDKRKVFTCPGSPIKDEYQLRIVDDHEQLVKTGETSLYDYIQSHADSVDIHKILERCAMIDDYSLLNRMPAQFMDVTQMPKNLAEAHAQILDAKNMFDRMPTDIKEEYNNNFVEFLSDLGSKKFENVVSDFLEKIKQPEAAATEVTDNES